MPTLPPADYRHVVTLQSLSQAPDDFGQLIPSWDNVGTFRALVSNQAGRLAGKEKLIAGQIKAELTHIVLMRYLGASIALKAGANRLIWNGRILNVVFVINVEELNQQYEVHCLEAEVEPDAAAP